MVAKGEDNFSCREAYIYFHQRNCIQVQVLAPLPWFRKILGGIYSWPTPNGFVFWFWYKVEGIIEITPLNGGKNITQSTSGMHCPTEWYICVPDTFVGRKHTINLFNFFGTIHSYMFGAYPTERLVYVPFGMLEATVPGTERCAASYPGAVKLELPVFSAVKLWSDVFLFSDIPKRLKEMSHLTCLQSASFQLFLKRWGCQPLDPARAVSSGPWSFSLHNEGATNFPQDGQWSFRAVECRGVNGFRVHCPFRLRLRVCKGKQTVLKDCNDIWYIRQSIWVVEIMASQISRSGIQSVGISMTKDHGCRYKPQLMTPLNNRLYLAIAPKQVTISAQLSMSFV